MYKTLCRRPCAFFCIFWLYKLHLYTSEEQRTKSTLIIFFLKLFVSLIYPTSSTETIITILRKYSYFYNYSHFTNMKITQSNHPFPSKSSSLVKTKTFILTMIRWKCFSLASRDIVDIKLQENCTLYVFFHSCRESLFKCRTVERVNMACSGLKWK